jgi:hypothetical protein
MGTTKALKLEDLDVKASGRSGSMRTQAQLMGG